MTKHIHLEVKDNIAYLLLDRPEKRNALNQSMWDELRFLLVKTTDDSSVKILVLGSTTSDVFCAGADIEEFSAMAGNEQWLNQNQEAIRDVQYRLSRFPKPTIAEISGSCVGGGCGLAIACDMRVAAKTARLGITPAKLGLVYSLHDTKLLVDLVGPARAKWILYTARLFSADESLGMGLVDQVVPTDQLRLTVDDLAHCMANNSQHSIRGAKQMVRMILHGAVDDTIETIKQFTDAFEGPDHHEGVGAFLAKRQPKFPVQ